MARPTPLTAAEPLLGGARGAHAAAGPSPFRSAATYACLLLAFCSAAVGMALHAGCMPSYQLPGAAARMCASPVANALTGTSFPAAPGRAPGSFAALDPVTGWLIEAGGGLAAADVMAFLLVINTAAVAALALGVAVLLRERAWLPVACLSPAIVFSMGQSLDPLGVACLIWALVLMNPTVPGPSSTIGAGVLFAAAVLINPLALIALVAVLALLRQVRQTSDMLMIGGVALITIGLALAVDGRIFARLAAWWAHPIDRGSIVSLLVYAEGLSDRLLAGLSLGLCVLALIVAGWVILRIERPNLYAVLAILFALAIVLLPAAPITHALWLLPFAALAVRRLWVPIAWALAETAFWIAVGLSDIAALEPSRGLAPIWLLLLTCLRIAAVLAVLIAAAAELTHRPAPGPRARGGQHPRPTDTSGTEPAHTSGTEPTHTSGTAAPAVAPSGPKD